MPIAPTYPGVYVQEIPSGVRTITGVATSITAFVGRTRRGDVETPTTINSYGDFERLFGGLWLDSPLTFAVRDFFLNGGAQAAVVRLVKGATFGQITMYDSAGAAAGFSFTAANVGSWALKLRVKLDRSVVAADLAGQPAGITLDDLFNLTVTDLGTGVTERYVNLTLKDGPARMDKVLAARSQLIRLSDAELVNATKFFTSAVSGVPPKSGTPANKPRSAVPQLTDRLTRAELLVATTPGDTNANAELTAANTDRSISSGDGSVLDVNSFFGSDNTESKKNGLFALEKLPLFNLLCIPPHAYMASSGGDIEISLVANAAQYAEKRRAMLILDPSTSWVTKKDASDAFLNETDQIGTRSKNAMMFFPRLVQPNPLRNNQLESFAPCGAIAGVIARTDVTRGLWKAPAGVDATLVGVPQLAVSLTDAENGDLNPLGLNCLRSIPEIGRVVWGARTLQGSDRVASDWKYIPVRRLALFIEESLYRGTQWVVFEPNGDPLWAQIRLNLGVFMNSLFRQGAFAGTTPRDAYFVKCDRETTTQADINQGIVNIVVGFAPLKPAEFVVLQLQQIAGQLVT